MTLADALARAATLGLQRLDAQLLLLHALGRGPHERAWLLAHDTDPLPKEAAAAYEALCARRQRGEPVAYLVGHKEFFGLELQVDARVLVPRPDTETLVEWALEVLQVPPSSLPAGSSRAQGAPGSPAAPQAPGPLEEAPGVIDLGTGSGAIALALKHRCPQARVHAVDASAAALALAQENARRLGLDIDWREASWLEGAPRQLALVVSNPPYIAQDDPHLAALTHEPLSALASGPDGLQDIRQIVTAAGGHLRPGGWLLLEHGWDQACAVRALLLQAGFVQVQSRTDLAGLERCSGGQWPG